MVHPREKRDSTPPLLTGSSVGPRRVRLRSPGCFAAGARLDLEGTAVAQYFTIPGTRTSAVLLPFDEAYADNLSEIPCPECLGDLDMHMPDPERPHLLLGTCHGCSTWVVANLNKSTMIKLPMSDLFEGP